MNREWRKGERVSHPKFGKGNIASYMSPTEVSVIFDGAGVRVVLARNLAAVTPTWRDVQPGDTVEFEVQGDTLSIKAKGEEGQPTVLGFKTTELDGVWDLLSIKKRNPPVPTHFGARVMYRDKQWALVYSAMVLGTGPKGITANMIWVEINEHTFNWVGHDDIDRETFEVLFEGWKTA